MSTCEIRLKFITIHTGYFNSPPPAWKNMKHDDDGDGVGEGKDNDGKKLKLLKQQDLCLKLR